MSDAPGTASSDDPMAPGWMHHREVDGERQLALSTVLEGLKAELKTTVDREKGTDPLLQVTECSVELGITWSVEGSGEIKFWVLDFTGKATRENSQTVTVKVVPTTAINYLQPPSSG